MSEIPQDPITNLATASAQQHEMFLAWVAAGFTEAQALELLKAFITAMVLKS
jgi:PIN domain nuclease of toxin-antitoxin system